jgi:hypothetical protein
VRLPVRRLHILPQQLGRPAEGADGISAEAKIFWEDIAPIQGASYEILALLQH